MNSKMQNLEKIKISINHPSEIYSGISRSFSKMLDVIESSSRNEDLVKLQNEAKKNLKDFNKNINTAISQLNEYSEWDKFTIAMFGMTNAGKSTIIECLRLGLGEQTKINEQEKFKKMQKQQHSIEEHIRQLDTELVAADTIIRQFEDDAGAEQVRMSRIILDFNKNMNDLKSRVVRKKSMFKWWQKIIFFFVRLLEEKQLIALVPQIKQSIADQELTKKAQLHKKSLLQKNRDVIEQAKTHTLNQLKMHLKEMQPYGDGFLVGNGAMDFTRKIHSYDFNINGKTLTLLDVPGIEGNENNLVPEITRAVKKSHAVFYVTSKDSTPEEGTLVKIKNYLNDQAEVWSIYNKRVTNVSALKENLVSGDDVKNSLNNLDNKMQQVLGNAYKGHHVLAGLPAFYALATCFDPCAEVNAKEKFLKTLSAQEVLNRSKLREFVSLLHDQIVFDPKLKINKANFKKAAVLVGNGAEVVNKICEEYVLLKNRLENIHKDSSAKIDNLKGALVPKLKASSECELKKFRETARAEIHGIIETDINNDIFKRRFTEVAQKNIEKLQGELELCKRNVLVEFDKNIKETVNDMESRMQSTIGIYQQKSTLAGMKLDFLNFKFNSGINKIGLITVAISTAIAMWWNPVGWVAGVLTAAGLLFSFAKAIWGFFDSDFKKSQQRKIADENLRKISEKVQEQIDDSFDKLKPVINNEVKVFIENLYKPVSDTSMVHTELADIASQFKQLAIAIAAEYGD